MNASPEERPQWMRILAFLYKHLGEDDVCSALRRRFAVCPETKVKTFDGFYVKIVQSTSGSGCIDVPPFAGTV